MAFTKVSKVHITEVGPRDGLQNESKVLCLDDKLEYINLLSQTGLKSIETTSFVRADKIPQMQDAGKLYEEVIKLGHKNISYPCLVPNKKGLESALTSKVSNISVFTATSNTFNKKNINSDVSKSLENIKEIIDAAPANIKIRGYISTVWGCPYEGVTSIDVLKKIAKELFSLGVYEISLGDTIGIATPGSVYQIINDLKKDFDLDRFSFHFHDTYARALANVSVCLSENVSRFDSSSGGLGGCPYAKGASGNLATEDLVDLLSNMNIETGIDMDKLVLASKFILEKLGKSNQVSSSKVFNVYSA